MTSTATARPRLTTTKAPNTYNTWIAFNHDKVLGRIYRDHSHNFYYMVNSRQPSQRFGTLNQAVSNLYEAVEAANRQHQEQIASEFESITANWGHVQIPSGNTRRHRVSSHIQTAIIGGAECVRTANGYISID